MAKIIRLAGVNLTDNTAPRIIERDAIESSGSLFLYDGAHPFGAFSGVWGNGLTIPNALANKAAALLGVAESSLNFTSASSGAAPTVGIFERTGKGGLHGILTQGTAQTGQFSSALLAAAAVRDYVKNNPTKAFYASIWSTITRVGIINAAQQSPMHMAASTSNFAFHFQAGIPMGPGPGSALVGASTSPSSVNGDHVSGTAVPYNRFTAIAFDEQTGSGPGSNPIEFGVGTFGAWNASNYNKCPSRIIYRAYMEDLTASGRTYAEVQALDKALFDAAFAVGGKFYGDTYTSPSTLP